MSCKEDLKLCHCGYHHETVTAHTTVLVSLSSPSIIYTLMSIHSELFIHLNYDFVYSDISPAYDCACLAELCTTIIFVYVLFAPPLLVIFSDFIRIII